MKARIVLSDYPRFTFHLLALYFLEQLCFLHARSVHINFYIITGSFDIDSFFDIERFPYNLLSDGGMILLGGWIADNITDKKKAMLMGLSLLLFGHITAFTNNVYISSFGYLFVNLGNAIFMITIFLHNAILYPKADDYKDNSFMLLITATGIAGIVNFFLSNYFFVYTDIGLHDEVLSKFTRAIISAIIISATFYFLLTSKKLGYRIEEDEIENDNLYASKSILLGLLILFVTFKIGQLIIAQISQGISNSLNSFLHEFMPTISWISLILSIVLLYYLLVNPKSYTRHYMKILFACFCFLASAGLGFIARNVLSFELYLISARAVSIVYDFLVFPVFLSVITHINFDKKAGLWLGVLLGGSQLVVSLVYYYYPYYENVFNILMPVLLIITIIWLRENKEFILNHLKLDEANQEEEEIDLGKGDPMDHLID